MTVSSTTGKAGPTTGNGVATSFPFDFKVFAAADLRVVLADVASGAETTLTLDSDYSVTLNADQDTSPGGSATYPLAGSPMTSASTLTIIADLDISQPTDITNGGGFYADVVEKMADRCVMLIRQVSETVSRALKLAVSTPDGVSADLPVPVANQILGWNADGTGFKNFAPVDNTLLALQLADPDGVLLVGNAADKRDLAASTGAGLIGWIQAGAGAVFRWVKDKLRERVSVFDFMTSAQITDVQTRAFTLDVTAAIQAAITYATSIQATLKIPAGLYKIVPATAFADEGADGTLAAFIMKSNLHIDAERGATFKIGDGVSTDAAPQSMGVFCTNEVLSDISIRGLTVDMNGANNKISPSRPTTYNRFNQSSILVSGTPSGVAARIDNMAIERCRFLNNPGVSTICAAQSNSVGVTIGKNWKINFNTFLNNGLDTDDHSSVFGWVDDVQFIGNDLDNDLKFHQVGSTGGNTGYEIHGNRHRIIGNKIRNYLRGVWVSSNLTDSYALDSIIANNHFATHFYAVDFFRSTSTLGQPKNTIIANNTAEFDDWTYTGAPSQKSVINISSECAQGDILISSNQALSTDTTVGAAFLTISAATVAANVHSNIVSRGNKYRGFVTGSNVRSNATNGLGYVAIEENEWIEPITTADFATPIHVFVDPVSTISTLSISGNRAIDERASPPLKYGTYVQAGEITDLYYADEFSKGLGGGADYYEAGVVSGNKHGYFDSLSVTPVFKASDTAFTLGNGTSAGRYTIHGKQVTYNASITVGSTSVVPAGNLSLDLPFTSSASGDVQYLGNWRIFDTSASTFTFGVLEADASATEATLQVSGGTFATDASPIALASGDKISAQITYTK